MRVPGPTTRLIPIALFALITGCVSPTTHRFGEATLPPRQNPTSRIISGAELAEFSGTTAYAAIEGLRPFFLRSRDQRLEPVVYVDNTSRRSVSDLKTISIESVAQIQYLDSRTATQKFGTGHSGGVILVLTRTGPR